MREITLSGYIDDEVWFGDEITPDLLHAAVYGEQNQYSDDVRIRLNSYGGSCNAATRMFDDIQAYPGSVHITISGTAASAATVLSMAADTLDMTPGSLYMIHDPSVLTWGNERDLLESVQLLRACKESILNVYAGRCKLSRKEVARLMTATCWMDATAALERGFIDSIVEPGPMNATALHVVDRAAAEAKVQAWLDRRKPQLSRPAQGDDHTSSVSPAAPPDTRPDDSGGTVPTEDVPTGTPDPVTEQSEVPGTPVTPPLSIVNSPLSIPNGTPVAQLQKRLGLIMPRK